MYSQVTALVSEDGGTFLGFQIKDEQVVYGVRNVRFNNSRFKGVKDNVHPLLEKAHQLWSGDYQGMANLLEEALQDQDFSKTVRILHRNTLSPIWGDLYDSDPSDIDNFKHINTYNIKSRSHDCCVKNLLSFVEKRLERQNAPLLERLEREVTLVKRKISSVKKYQGLGLITLFSAAVLASTFMIRSTYQLYSSLAWKVKSAVF